MTSYPVKRGEDMHTSIEAGELQAKLEEAKLNEGLEATSKGQECHIAAAVNGQDADSDLFAKIVRQVNFYFSDTNLPTDHFLLKEVKRSPEGWGAHAVVRHKVWGTTQRLPNHKLRWSAVPIRLIAGFKKIKSLTKDLKTIVAALETSPELVINGHRVRRKLPLPLIDEADVLMRTVIVENLPHQANIGAPALGICCGHSEPIEHQANRHMHTRHQCLHSSC